jgi:hypothetical protein
MYYMEMLYLFLTFKISVVMSNILVKNNLKLVGVNSYIITYNYISASNFFWNRS